MQTTKHSNPFNATLTGILDLFRRKHPVGEVKETDRIDGKTVLITGANKGLGYALAVQLAQRGGYIIMACRSGIPDAGQRVKKESGSDKVEMLPLDLTDFNSIRAFCKSLHTNQRHIDILILNAGVVPNQARKTEQGFEEMFAVNYLANFLLVNTLLKQGTIPNSTFAKKSKRKALPRIIFVSSESHRSSPPIDFDSLGTFKHYTMGKSVAEYGTSKLLLETYAHELGRRLQKEDEMDVSVFSLCPGPVNTEIAREAPSWSKPLVKIIFGLFFRSPSKAAEPVIYLACSLDVEKRTLVYMHLMQEKAVSPEASSVENGMRLWKKSEELIKNGPPTPSQ